MAINRHFKTVILYCWQENLWVMYNPIIQRFFCVHIDFVCPLCFLILYQKALHIMFALRFVLASLNQQTEVLLEIQQFWNFLKQLSWDYPLHISCYAHIHSTVVNDPLSSVIHDWFNAVLILILIVIFSEYLYNLWIF